MQPCRSSPDLHRRRRRPARVALWQHEYLSRIPSTLLSFRSRTRGERHRPAATSWLQALQTITTCNMWSMWRWQPRRSLSRLHGLHGSSSSSRRLSSARCGQARRRLLSKFTIARTIVYRFRSAKLEGLSTLQRQRVIRCSR